MSRWHRRSGFYWLAYLEKAIVTSRLSGIQPWYQVPSSQRTVILSRSGALHGRNNGVPLLRLMKGCGQGVFVFLEQPRKKLAGRHLTIFFLRFGEYLDV